LPASLMSMVGYWLVGLWKPAVTHYYLLALPGVLLGIVLGRAANGRMDARSFLRYLHVGLAAVGCLLMLQVFL
ncbi:MAG: sulfite exporter TauE/SafE family protein, partial [Steroidobacteraceae bacterium]